MAQNKLISKLQNIMHEWDVQKQRRYMLVSNYQEGLKAELQMLDESYLAHAIEKIERYYQEDIEKDQQRLNGLTKSLEIKKKKIYDFDQKAYWARRKFKTKTLRSMGESKLDTVLLKFDEEQTLKRNAYLALLEEKYPDQSLSQTETHNHQKRIQHFDSIRDRRIKKAKEKATRKHARFIKFIEKNALLIKRKEETIETLKQKITAYNEKLVVEEKILLEKIERKIETIHQSSSIPEKYKAKKLESLHRLQDRIVTTANVLQDDTIHLSISKLKMYFGGVKAVNDLSFDVKKGEVFGLIGPNGAGKTTVFNCLTQFYKATSGSMIFRNKENNIINLYQKKTHDMISEGIARSFQNVELIWELTVIDNLLVAAHSLLITNFGEHMAHSQKMVREEAVLRTKGMHILETLGIQAYAYRSPYGLPYGVLKKIELARTLMTDPSLIILDEPAAGLNDSETADLAKVIKDINKTMGITIFLVEHDMGLVMSICDRICAISFGKMIGLGTPKEIQQNPEVRKAYLGDDSDE